MLTTFDKLWHAVFAIATVTFMTAGACLPIIYLIPPENLPAPGQDYTPGQIALCFGGMALGFAASLSVFAFLSRRFASDATHRRWIDNWNDSPYLQSRFSGLIKLIKWALIPPEH